MEQLLFCDITWGAGGSTSQLSMDIAIHIQQKLQITCNLHMTCTNMIRQDDEETPVPPKQSIQNSIQEAIHHDVLNIFALRGDPPVNPDGSHSSTFVPTPDGFTCALDLVQFIRSPETRFDAITSNTTQLGVGVAGYPEGHPVAITMVEDATSLTPAESLRSSVDVDTQTTYTCRDVQYQKELEYLQQKVNAGADFIITQMFFDTTVYIQFVHDCRTMGITCPILPGIMCINNITGFFKMTKFCKTRIPADLLAAMTDLQTKQASAEDIKAFGIQYGVEQCRQMIHPSVEIMELYPNYTVPPVLHFYTLNLEKVVMGILQELGYSINSTTTASD